MAVNHPVNDNKRRDFIVGRKPGPPRTPLTVALPSRIHAALRDRAESFGGQQSRVLEEALNAFFKRADAGDCVLVFRCDPDEWIKNTFRINPEAKRRLQALSGRCGAMFTIQNICYAALLAYLENTG